MGDEPKKSQNWLHTMPGVLGSLATLITASTGLIVAYQQLANQPSPAPLATVSPTSPPVTTDAPAPTPIGEPAVTPSSAAPPAPIAVDELEGRYTFAWVEVANNNPSACLPSGSIDLRMDKDGEMRGSSVDRSKFEGTALGDGTWTGNLSIANYQFVGTISNGVFSGTYTAQPQGNDATPCQGTITGRPK